MAKHKEVTGSRHVSKMASTSQEAESGGNRSTWICSLIAGLDRWTPCPIHQLKNVVLGVTQIANSHLEWSVMYH